jgi:hypothetical protein
LARGSVLSREDLVTPIRVVAWVLALMLPVGATGLGAAPQSGPAPAASSCEIEGEGSLSTNPDARFELEAEDEPGHTAPEGEVNYRDARAGLRVRATHLTTVLVRGIHGTVRGLAQLGGTGIEFTVEVEDRTPEGGLDRFHIRLSSGYVAEGDIEKGGVEIECEEEEGAVATSVVGRAIRSPEVRSLGSDLSHAQVVSGVLTRGIKLAAGRTRPDGSNQHSFPSGHSSATFATATVLEQHYGWKVGLPAYTFAVCVAGSRLQENKHFPSDVLFGAALGSVGGRSVTAGRGRAQVSLVPLPVPEGGFGVAVVGAWH